MPLRATSSAEAPVAGSGPAGTSIATTAFRNSGWSTTPTGSVAYSRETATSRDVGERRERVDRGGERRGRVADVRPQPDVRPHAAHGPSPSRR